MRFLGDSFRVWSSKDDSKGGGAWDKGDVTYVTSKHVSELELVEDEAGEGPKSVPKTWSVEVIGDVGGLEKAVARRWHEVLKTAQISSPSSSSSICSDGVTRDNSMMDFIRDEEVL